MIGKLIAWMVNGQTLTGEVAAVEYVPFPMESADGHPEKDRGWWAFLVIQAGGIPCTVTTLGTSYIKLCDKPEPKPREVVDAYGAE